MGEEWEPVVSVSVGRWFLPALIGLGIQQAVIGVDRVAQVIPVVLLACGSTHTYLSDCTYMCACVFVSMFVSTHVFKRTCGCDEANL